MNIVNSYFTINPFDKSDECALFTIDDTSTPYTLSDVVDIDQEYTLSFWVKSENSGRISIGDQVIQTSPEWFRYINTFKATSTTLKMFFGVTGSYFVYKAKLELGNTPTDWTPAPEDLETEVEGVSIEVSKRVTPDQMDDAIGAIDEFHNTAVDITSDGVTMKTTGSIRAIVDEEERLTIDEEAVKAPLIVADEVRADNLFTVFTGSTVEWKGSIQKSIDALPKYLIQDTDLTIPAGTYPEDVTIRGFYGSRLRLTFAAGACLNGRLNVYNCSHVVVRAATLGNGYIHPRSAGDGTVNFYAVTRAQVSNMYISGYRGRKTSSDGSDIALYFNSCHALVENCCLEYANKGLSSNYSVVYANGNIGGTSGNDPTTNANLTYGILASYGSHVFIVGNYPMGNVGYSGYRGVVDTFSLGDATPGGWNYVAPTEITKSFAISKHCTYKYGTGRIRDDQSSTFSQGRYGAYSTGVNDWRIGAMWFADAASALSGKTIVKATLTMRRATGGWSSPVNVYLGRVALAESNFASTNSPTFTAAATYPIGTLARETEAVYDVTALMSSIKSGQAIGVFEPRSEYSGSWSTAYTQFYGKGSAYEPVLTVTYKD